MSRNQLIQIYNNTRNLSQNYEKPQKSIKIKYDNLQIQQTSTTSKSRIMIFNDDTLIIANKLYLSTKSNILVLNMASEYKAGGGVENGAMAQEEELFRRSNYFESLTPNLYPIKEFEAVYTKDVCIFKDDNYNLITSFKCSFVAIPAIRKPYLKNYKYNSIDRDIMRKKIDFIFKIAIYYNYKNIVLGALGCGAFGNPPEEVAELFNDVIQKYHNNFDNIYFAIKSIRDINYDTFLAKITI